MNYFLLYLKGLLMGICDLIPGISGGTIAFITGIYERLINAVKAFSPELMKNFFGFIFNSSKENKKRFLENVKKLDLVFLIVLFGGIGTALLAGSRGIKFMLENYFSFTISFFIGLIIASSKVIYDKIDSHKIEDRIFGLLGLLVGLSFAMIIPANITPSLLYLFFGGFLSISAMFLPGISGAFILLILGLYEFMIDVLHDIIGKIEYFIVFILGAGLGAFTISRVVSFLFKKDKCKTLYFLLGLVIGSLSIPLKRTIDSVSVWSTSNISIMLLFIILGILSVIIVTRFDKNGKKD